jgi:mRNA interferase MazF
LFIDITSSEERQTGLRLESTVQCENLITYDRVLILRTLGSLSAGAMSQVDDCLKAALGIPRI